MLLHDCIFDHNSKFSRKREISVFSLFVHLVETFFSISEYEYLALRERMMTYFSVFDTENKLSDFLVFTSFFQSLLSDHFQISLQRLFGNSK